MSTNFLRRKFQFITGSAKDLAAIQNLLLDYYNNALQNELDRVIEEKNISRKDYEKILLVHNQLDISIRNIDA